MLKDKKRCADCGGEMVEGFLLDWADSMRLVQRWIGGRPRHSDWGGMLILEGAECRAVETHRCGDCGLLKSYATTEVAPADVFAP
jgi:hypothetical protein